MKLTVLGAHGPYAPVGGATSSYLIEAVGMNILLDMGSGSLANLQKYVSVGDVDAIVLTHAHYDHTADFYLYKYALGIKKKNGKSFKCPLVCMPEPCALAGDGDEGILDVIYASEQPEIEIGNVRLSFKEMRHPARCFGVRVTCEGKTIAYTGDTNTCAGLEEFVEGSDLAVIDAGLSSADYSEAAPHLSIGQAAELAKLSRNGVLSHIYPAYTAELVESESNGVTRVFEGDVFEL